MAPRAVQGPRRGGSGEAGRSGNWCSPRRPAGRPPPARREYKKPRARGEKGGREGPTDHFGGELTWGRCVQGRAGADARVRRTPGECTRESGRVVGCVPGLWPLVRAKGPVSKAHGAPGASCLDQTCGEIPLAPISIRGVSIEYRYGSGAREPKTTLFSPRYEGFLRAARAMVAPRCDWALQTCGIRQPLGRPAPLQRSDVRAPSHWHAHARAGGLISVSRLRTIRHERGSSSAVPWPF